MTGRIGTTLGLDIGTNSIGWAIVEQDEITPVGNILASGSRIFQEAVESRTRTPKNRRRREARGHRRVLKRRKQRRNKLRNILVHAGFIPPELMRTNTPEVIFNDLGNPYELRKKGLDHRLTAYEFGRVLDHICARRGFRSNRKALLGALLEEFEDLADANVEHHEDDDPEEGKIKSEIAGLREEIHAKGCRTLGEFLAGIPDKQLKRCRHTDRGMFRDEFEKLWSAQEVFHPKLKDEAFKAEVYDSVFRQRPLKSAKFLIGRCLFEPQRKRTAKARLEAQEFRLRQDINNLEIMDPETGEFRSLTEAQRKEIFELLHQPDKLTKARTLSWSKIRKLLGIHKGERINLEAGNKRGLPGNRTWCDLVDILGDRWVEMAEIEKVALVEDLLTIADKPALIRRLQQYWKMDRKSAYLLAVHEFEPGYAAQSLKAVNKLLPPLRRGLKYHKAREEAGYSYAAMPKTSLGQLPEPPAVRNPVVCKALYEVRKVVNAIIREHGMPDVIRVEMAREMKVSQKKKAQQDKQRSENQKLNEEADEKLRELGIANPDRDARLKYRLWKECPMCPYTGQSIGMTMLFGPEVDIEHILPYSRTLDDSYMNKTLCISEENRLVKKNMTPHEAYSGDQGKWDAIRQRIRHHRLPEPKIKRFERKELDKIDDFIARQLVDTSHIAVQTKNYLGLLDTDVQVTRGGTTADLRRHWSLNHLLGFDHDKKERTDHRHHALDAVVIALTDRGLYQRISRIADKYRVSPKQPGFELDPPWQELKRDVARALDKIVVSHAPSRQLQGALHEETAYGYHKAADAYVYRKPLDSSLTRKRAEQIIDPEVRHRVLQRLDEHSNDAKKAFARQLFHKDGKTPIKKARVHVNFDHESTYGVENAKGKKYKFLRYGNNHHVEILGLL